MIPTSKIQSIISSREHLKSEAIEVVSQKWANCQTIVGPYISIPYYQYIEKKDEGTQRIKKYLHILPKDLNIKSELIPEKRKRGIFEIIVYQSEIHVEGNFEELATETLGINSENIQFSEAKFNVGISDLKGIRKQVMLNFNDSSSYFNPGIENTDIYDVGISSPIDIDPIKATKNKFSFDLDLIGSESIFFTPVGKTSTITMQSSWSSPKFDGNTLPVRKNISDSGFVATWNILHLNRNFPQQLKGSNHEILNSAFGVNLMMPIDNYQKSYRSIQYAILFIGLTFTCFFFIEVLNKRNIHPIQYILVGLALVIFFTLLISISEFLSFNASYLISASATLLLITIYTREIFKSNALSLMLFAILFMIYVFIFVIIQMEDKALLFGSIGIFMILAIVMYLSRKIDWSNIDFSNREK